MPSQITEGSQSSVIQSPTTLSQSMPQSNYEKYMRLGVIQHEEKSIELPLLKRDFLKNRILKVTSPSSRYHVPFAANDRPKQKVNLYSRASSNLAKAKEDSPNKSL